MKAKKDSVFVAISLSNGRCGDCEGLRTKVAFPLVSFPNALHLAGGILSLEINGHKESMMNFLSESAK